MILTPSTGILSCFSVSLPYIMTIVTISNHICENTGPYKYVNSITKCSDILIFFKEMLQWKLNIFFLAHNRPSTFRNLVIQTLSYKVSQKNSKTKQIFFWPLMSHFCLIFFKPTRIVFQVLLMVLFCLWLYFIESSCNNININYVYI